MISANVLIATLYISRRTYLKRSILNREKFAAKKSGKAKNQNRGKTIYRNFKKKGTNGEKLHCNQFHNIEAIVTRYFARQKYMN